MRRLSFDGSLRRVWLACSKPLLSKDFGNSTKLPQTYGQIYLPSRHPLLANQVFKYEKQALPRLCAFIAGSTLL